MTNANLPVIKMVISVILGVAGQFLFKQGVKAWGQPVEISPAMIKLFLTPYVFAGITCYVLSTFTYLSALSQLELSVAYPMISAGYILVFIISIVFLKEPFTLTKLLANLMIIGGILLLFWK